MECQQGLVHVAQIVGALDVFLLKLGYSSRRCSAVTVNGATDDGEP